MTGPESDFIVHCEDCEMERRTDDFEDAVDFSVNHHRHTGHTVSWDTSTLVDGVVSIPRRTRWKVECGSCQIERFFRNCEDAKEFFDSHETYAGHTPDTIEEIQLPEVSEIGTGEFQEVLDYCFDHAESTETIPIDAVLTAFEQAGLTRERVTKELEQAQKQNDTYHLGDGLLTR